MINFKLGEKWKKLKPYLANAALILSLFGFTVITVTSSIWNHFPWAAPKEFESHLKDIRPLQSYDFTEKSMGVPNIYRPIEYSSLLTGDRKSGVQTIYYYNNYIFFCFFDCNQSLFGYLLIDDNLFLDPKIPFIAKTKCNRSQKLKSISFDSADVENPYMGYAKPSLSKIFFNARSGDSYIGNFYTEVYNLNGMGFLGLVETDYINRKSNDRKKFLEQLRELSYPDKINPFYQNFSCYFHGVSFMCEDEEKIDKIKAYIDRKNVKLNAFFLFSIQSDVDVETFMREQLRTNLFTDKMFILQQQ